MYQITKEKYTQNLQERYPNEDFTVLTFTAATQPVTIHCNRCQHTFSYKSGATLYSKKRKHLCSLCASYTVKQLLQNCKENHLIILDNPGTVIEPWTLQCTICGQSFSRVICGDFTGRCPHCNKQQKEKNTQQKWQTIVDEICGENEFEVLLGTNTDNFLVRHTCGFIRKTQGGAFFRAPWCPRCKGTLSRGEARISDYLTQHAIAFQSQKKLNTGHQRFDFFIEPNIAIEFNGKQHYEPIEIFGGEKRFQEQQQYDKSKQQYCEENNILLLVISYKEYNKIEDILDDFFKKFNDQPRGVGEN